MVGWLCLMSHRQRCHLEMAPPFTVPCEGREARLIHRSDRELNPRPSHGSPLRYRCATQAPLYIIYASVLCMPVIQAELMINHLLGTEFHLMRSAFANCRRQGSGNMFYPP